MIRLLLLAFPRAWRRRYGRELAELTREVGIGPRVALDLLRAGARQRWRAVQAIYMEDAAMYIGPAWRHPTRWAIIGAAILVPTALFVGGSMLAHQVGISALRGVTDPVGRWLDALPMANLLLVVAPAAAAAAALAPLLRLDLPGESGTAEAAIGIRLRTLNLLVAAAAVTVAAALLWYFVGEFAPRAAGA